MNEIPWFAVNPSPFTLIYWLLLTAYGTRILLKGDRFKRWRHLFSFMDAALILGTVVLFNDFFWVITSGWRWGHLYPGSLPQLYFCAFRDVAGVVFCWMLTRQHWSDWTIHIGRGTVFLEIINLSFFAIWFLAASSPADTDWTFALRHGYSMTVVWRSFFVSHIIGKLILALIFFSVWTRLSLVPSRALARISQKKVRDLSNSSNINGASDDVEKA